MPQPAVIQARSRAARTSSRPSTPAQRTGCRAKNATIVLHVVEWHVMVYAIKTTGEVHGRQSAHGDTVAPVLPVARGSVAGARMTWRALMRIGELVAVPGAFEPACVAWWWG